VGGWLKAKRVSDRVGGDRVGDQHEKKAESLSERCQCLKATTTPTSRPRGRNGVSERCECSGLNATATTTTS
jgi:hypothetical protein